MIENFADLISDGNPDATPTQYGLVVTAPAESSFELETMERAMQAMAAQLAAFGRDDGPEFVETDEDGPITFAAGTIPLTALELELLAIEDAILNALANLGTHRVAIARATKNRTDYIAACAADGITPF